MPPKLFHRGLPHRHVDGLPVHFQPEVVPHLKDAEPLSVEQRRHTHTVDPPRQVVVETVHRLGHAEVLHQSRHLPVGQRAAHRYECRVREVHLRPVRLIERHGIVSRLTEIDMPDHLRIVQCRVDARRPHRCRRVRPCRLALEPTVAPQLIACQVRIEVRLAVRKSYHRQSIPVLLVRYYGDMSLKERYCLTADSPVLKDPHGIVHVPCQRLSRVTFGIEHRVQTPQPTTIPTVVIVHYRHVGKVRQHLTDDLPLVASELVKATEVLTDEVHHVAPLARIAVEVPLPVLLLRMRDDDGVKLLTPAVGQDQLDVPSHTRLSVELVAEREGNIVNAHPWFHFLKRYVRHRLVV